jgi:hypothetical protein
MFDIGVVHITMAGYNVDQHCLRFDRGVVHIIVAGYNVDQYSFMFDIGVDGQQYHQPQQYEPLFCQT